MKRSGTTIRLTLAVLGTVALFGAAAAAGVDRNAEMKASGIAPEHSQTSAGPSEIAQKAEFTAQSD